MARYVTGAIIPAEAAPKRRGRPPKAQATTKVKTRPRAKAKPMAVAQVKTVADNKVVDKYEAEMVALKSIVAILTPLPQESSERVVNMVQEAMGLDYL